MPPTPTTPILAQYPSDHLTLAAGIAIFHLATSRVLLCYHTRDNYYFLPKGRKNANEALERAAEREGFEETGYRNRLLPLPMRHRATEAVDFVTEPWWVQLLPLSRGVQYVLHWYVGETVPAEVERSYDVGVGVARGYRPPEPFPEGLTLKERIKQDEVVDAEGKVSVYEPVWHDGMAQDEEEMCYRTFLVSVEEARRKLKGSVMEDVVRRGWEKIRLRLEMEENDEVTAGSV